MKMESTKIENLEDQKVFKLKNTNSLYHVFSRKTDQEIWNAFQAGNEGAFNYIYFTFFTSLYNYCNQFYNDKETVKDLIQDFFIYLRENCKNLGEITYLKAYLFKSMRRRVQAYIKQKNRLSAKEKKEFHEFRISISQERQMVNQALNEEKKKVLQEALNLLTKRQREAIFYYFYENLGYEEIALIMDISNVKSVRNLIYRSLNVMRVQSNKYDKILFCFL